MRKGLLSAFWLPTARLEAVVADRNSAHKHVWRVRIMLLTANGHGITEITRRTVKSETPIWRWEQRQMQAGVNGPLRDKARPFNRIIAAVKRGHQPLDSIHQAQETTRRPRPRPAGQVSLRAPA